MTQLSLIMTHCFYFVWSFIKKSDSVNAKESLAGSQNLPRNFQSKCALFQRMSSEPSRFLNTPPLMFWYLTHTHLQKKLPENIPYGKFTYNECFNICHLMWRHVNNVIRNELLVKPHVLHVKIKIRAIKSYEKIN